MNLRTGAIVLSLLPLGLTLLLAAPENLLQQRVNTSTLETRRTALSSGAARDIEDARIDALVALRGEGQHKPRSQAAFRRSISLMRSSMLHLNALAGPDRASLQLARPIVAAATAVADRFDDIEAQSRHGNFKALNAVMPPAYYTDISHLQAAVRAFIKTGRAAQANQIAALARLLSFSQVLLVLEIAGLAATSALLLFVTGRHVGQLLRYRLLAEITRDIILFVDAADLTVIDANSAALEAFGYNRSELIGKSARAIRAPETPLTDELLRQSETPAGSTSESLHLRSDGSVFAGEARARTSMIGGRETIVVTIRDITERRQAAEQVELALQKAVDASRLKSEFVATMSHEIRTPMHGVIGMSELLLASTLTPLQHEYAVTLKESGEALLAIIDDILDFSKLEAGRIELESMPFEPARIIAGVLNIVRPAAERKSLSLRSELSPQVPETLTGDPARLRQILLNLVGNAVKFTGSGSITVATSVEREDDRNVVVRFDVTDTGIGVTAEARERLFEAFVQGDGSTTRRFGGTGLGLSISRRLVELMAGRIWLEERAGPGSTFCFTVRLERTPSAAAP